MVSRSDPAYRFAISKGLKYKVVMDANGKRKGMVLAPNGKPIDAWVYYRKSLLAMKPKDVKTVPKKIQKIEAPKVIQKIEAPKELPRLDPPKVNLFSEPINLLKPAPTKLF